MDALNGVRDTVNILLLPNLSLSEIYEAALVERQWDRTLNTITVATIVRWEVSKSMLDQWAFLLVVLWVPPKKHCRVYELMLMIDAAEEVNTGLRSKAKHRPTMPEDIVRLIQN